LLSGSEHQKGMLRDSSRDTISDRFSFYSFKNKKMTAENKNDRDWMILKIYERLRKHREIRI
jgi:hypothetical protein